jgi:hypothetical protein
MSPSLRTSIGPLPNVPSPYCGPNMNGLAANQYVLAFRKEEIPPMDAFWSATLYDDQGFQAANVLNRFAVSSWMPLQYNPDGSIDLSIQHDDPGGDKTANWLPASAGSFNLTMRLYAPKPAALTGEWNPPAVTRS